MTAFQIFGLQFLLSGLLWILLARWYVAPQLAPLPLPSALAPLLWPHAFRHMGMVFLVPTVTGGAPLPEGFAVPAAWGDLLAALLALAALVALRARWAAALGVVWVANTFGALDLLYALSQGVRLRPALGAAYYIPIVVVPMLLVSHAMIFARLLRRPA